MRRKKRTLTWVLVAVVAVLLVGVASYFVATQTKSAGDTAGPTVIKGNATDGDPTDDDATPTPTATPAGSTPEASSPPVAPPSKPVLNMSSGNAGVTVPAGRAMEFTCEGAAGLSCKVTLTNKTNPAQSVDLGTKPIASNGHGQYLAAWEWIAAAGQWTVVATAVNGGDSTPSDALSLEVK